MPLSLARLILISLIKIFSNLALSSGLSAILFKRICALFSAPYESSFCPKIWLYIKFIIRLAQS
ncbi:MAG: hypothetical protein D8H92_03220 [Campylobacter sp.]|nr:MAG: hypothetical protein D8H92_03220 [Campylobacter sp.]